MQGHDYVTGIVLDDRIEFSLIETCRLCRVQARHVAEMVDEGILQPTGARPLRWRFNGVMVRRLQVAVRLERDLGVNLPGAAVILEMLEQLEELRRLAAGRQGPAAHR